VSHIKVGQLVEFADHDFGAGFAPPPIRKGIVLSIVEFDSEMDQSSDVEILTFDGAITREWEDDLEVIGEIVN